MTQTEPKQDRFDPNKHMMQLKSKDGMKDYLPVQWRIVWFRLECPNGTIDTEELAYDLDREITAEVYAWNAETRRSEKVIKKAKGYARYRAVVTDGKGGRATGTKSESAVNFADFGEKSETGAIGRALAVLGYGTAGAPELDGDEQHIVDSPIEHQDNHAPVHEDKKNVPIALTIPPETDNEKASSQQKDAIRKMCATLKRGVPENIDSMTAGSAKILIVALSDELKNLRKAS